ncbi:hypothetical protein [Nocardiopsis halophila]|uniref:hypothetical protein n=1 Tax=Nocardiopsis halophila TaxID=141692 RepID=UPI001268EC87|nr:hypothetical protein [Nocardiopsis halophila]
MGTAPKSATPAPGPARAAVRRAARTAAPAVLALLIGSGAVAACSAHGGGPGDGQGDPRAVTDGEEKLLERAEEVLLRECMEDHGFEYRITEDETPPEIGKFPYVIDDPEWAAEHGYGSGLRRKVAELREEDPNQRYFNALPEDRRQEALRAANGPSPVGIEATTPDGMELGRSDQGCRSQAQRELYGDLEGWFQATTTVDALENMRRDRVVSDPAYEEAAASWSVCMKEAGHDYTTPMEVRRSLPPPDDPLPEDEETALAVAEAECAQETGLGDTADELDRQYGDELRREHRSAVEERRRLQLDALPRARSVTGESEEGSGQA